MPVTFNKQRRIAATNIGTRKLEDNHIFVIGGVPGEVIHRSCARCSGNGGLFLSLDELLGVHLVDLIERCQYFIISVSFSLCGRGPGGRVLGSF